MQGQPLEVALARALHAEEVRETHTSWVFLTASRAYKLKKPVRFGFVDLTSRQARRRSCQEEVRVNQTLAPNIVLGVRSIVCGGDALRLGDADDDGAVDWVVEMVRFDEGATMAALAARGDLKAADANRVGRRIAMFHARAPRVERPDAARRASETWSRNLGELAEVAPSAFGEQLDALSRFGAAFLRRRAIELDARGLGGSIREGHGDLRAEHVLVDEDVTIVDRLEFDRELREVDVADDLAFLVMDLEAAGVRWAADAVVAAYRAAGGDPGDAALIAFFAAYRATVRAKVELLRAAQLDDQTAAARRTDRARGLLRLAEHFSWRARDPGVLIVCGPPASGKSHLADAIAARTRAAVLSSDAARKELLGLAPDETAPLRAYFAAERERVYAELASRLALLPLDAPAIVDATFGTRAIRDRFAAAADGHRLRWIECHVPLATLLHRARNRRPAAAHGSDAGPAVAGQLAAAFEPLDEIPPEARMRIDGTAPTDETLRRLGMWLDDGSVEDVGAAA